MGPVRATVLTACVAALSLRVAMAADTQPATEKPSVAQAEKLLQEGANRRDILAMLEPLALNGNIRAQLLVGAIHLEGRDVPRDPVEGCAWLKLAATSADRTLGDQAQAMLRQTGAMLTGIELIQVDRRAAVLQAAVTERDYAEFGGGLRQFTDERPLAFAPWITFASEIVQLKPVEALGKNPDVMLGCAVAWNRLCKDDSRKLPETRCTGRIIQPTSGASALPTATTYTVMPYYPVELRRRRVGGAVWVIAHVDRSGWICAAAIAGSSGESLLNQAALEAISLWRLNPATRANAPIEALHLVRIAFSLSD